MKRLASFFPVFAFITTAILFTPIITVYDKNMDQFCLGMKEYIQVLTGVAILLSLVISVILSFLPKGVRLRTEILFLALGLLAYLQVNFLSQNYGLLAGGQPNWALYNKWGQFEAAIWLGVLILGVLNAKRLAPHVRNLAVLLFLLQAILLGKTYYQDESSARTRMPLDYRDLAKLNSKKNVMILSFDSFQGDTFEAAIKDEPELAKPLDGFVFYRDTTSPYHVTYPSLFTLTSGHYYRNEVNVDRFLDANFARTEGLLPRLKQAGYDVRFFAVVGSIFTTVHPVFANGTETYDARIFTRVDEWAKLASASAFQMLPHYLKQSIFTNRFVQFSMGFVGDRWLLDYMTQTLKLDNEKPTYTFIHFIGVHTPIYFDENNNFVSLPRSQVSYTRAARGLMKQFEPFIQKLKEAGVYDNTMLILTADHGAGMTSRETGVGPIQAGAMPLLAVKDFGAHGELKTSQVQACTMDMAPTIAARLGLPNEDLDGKNLFELKVGENRERHYMHFNYGEHGGDGYGIPAPRQISIIGPARDTTNWRDDHIVWGREKKDIISIPTFFVGQIYEFGANEPATEALNPIEWSPDSTGSWSQAPKARLTFKFNSRGIPLHLRLRTYVDPNGAPFRRFTVNVNGRQLAERPLSNGDHFVLLPPMPEGEHEINLVFDVPKAEAEAWRSMESSDNRVQGLFLNELEIRSFLPTLPEQRIGFTLPIENDQALTSGWSWVEPDGVWSDGTSSEMEFPVAAKDYQATISLKPFTAAPKLSQQRVTILAAGKIVWSGAVQGAKDISFSIPANTIQQDRLKLTFQLPDAASPSALGTAKDDRKMGIQIKKIDISPVQIKTVARVKTPGEA